MSGVNTLRSSSVEISAPCLPALALCGLLAGCGPGRAFAAPPPAAPLEPGVTLESGWLLEDPDGSVRLVAGIAPSGATATQLLTGRFRHDGPDPAAGLRIVLAIPGGMHYVEASASGPGAAISFSADGGRSFEESPAPAAELTHIRWDLAGKFEPGTAGLVSFQVIPADVARAAVAPTGVAK
jgi:hypothetical protein